MRLLRCNACCCFALWFSVLGCWPVFGQRSEPFPPDSFSNVLKNEANGLSQESIDEIIEIRKRLGGGTGLEGFEFEFEFANPLPENSLERLPGGFGLPEASDLPGGSGNCLGMQESSFEPARSPFERFSPDMPRPGGVAGGTALAGTVSVGTIPTVGIAVSKSDGEKGSRERVVRIRDAARRFDELAADLEDLELFADADALRALASTIRRRVRPSGRTGPSTRGRRR